MEKESLSSDFSSTASSYKSSVKLSEDYIDTYITIPPDGGWGWIVVMGSFFCNFVADGAIYTFGLFLNDISKTFSTDPTKVAIANSLMTGFYYMSGPVSCALVNHLGFQVTGIMGGLIAAAAFSFSTIVTSLTAFLIVFGVIGGFGFGLVYVPSVVVVGFYFEKWRALATSVAVTGSAAGIIGFPLIIEGILANYDWKLKFRVISAICLIVGIMALLYRPLKPTRVLTNRDKTILQILSTGDGDQSLQGMEEKEHEKIGFFEKIFRRFHNTRYPTHAQLYKESTTLMYFPPGPSASSIFINSIAEGSTSTFVNPSPSKNLEARSEKLDKVSRLSTVYEDETLRKGHCCQRLCCPCKCCRVCCGTTITNRPMYRDDIFYGASLFTLSEYSQAKASHFGKIKSMDYTMSVTRVELLKEAQDQGVCCKCCPESVLRTLATMMNLKLLKSPSFLLLATSGFFTILGMYVPFIYLIQRADEINIDRNMSKFLYTAVGISNALGRIFSGIASSHPKANSLIVSYVTLFICGVSTVCSYFLKDFYSHLAYCTIFGLTVASFASLRTPLLVELLGLQNLTNAFGILLLFNGIAGFLGVPIAGTIVTATNSFNSSFLFAGSVIILSAILLIPIKMISAKETKLNIT